MTKKKQHEFKIIERHLENGTTLDEIMNSTHDWFSKVLITGEFRKNKDSVRLESRDK